ncbi:hypothetical protein [Pseudoalteromonas rubra]|nr:hypothetical protein [Pseudoalteromonas rubra]
MKNTKAFTPKTIEQLQLKDVSGGYAFDRPIFIGYQEPIENIKF